MFFGSETSYYARHARPCNELKNAGRQMSVIFLIPIPPFAIGSVVWIHWLSSKVILKIDWRHCFRQSSICNVRSGYFQNAQVRTMYVSFGMNKQFFRRQ